jgi:hypothetical protein
MIWNIVQQCIADVEGSCVPTMFSSFNMISVKPEDACIALAGGRSTNVATDGYVTHSLKQKRSRSRRRRREYGR